MKNLLSLLCLCIITLMVTIQNSTAQDSTRKVDSYQPCTECFGYNTNEYNTYEYNSNTTAEQQYNQTCINGLNYENGYENTYSRPRYEFGNRILRIAIGLVSFAVIVAILPRNGILYIQ